VATYNFFADAPQVSNCVICLCNALLPHFFFLKLSSG